MEKTVALLEKGVLGMHEGQHLGRETTARSEQVLGQSEREKSLSLTTHKQISARSNPFPSQSNLRIRCLSLFSFLPLTNPSALSGNPWSEHKAAKAVSFTPESPLQFWPVEYPAGPSFSPLVSIPAAPRAVPDSISRADRGVGMSTHAT